MLMENQEVPFFAWESLELVINGCTRHAKGPLQTGHDPSGHLIQRVVGEGEWEIRIFNFLSLVLFFRSYSSVQWLLREKNTVLESKRGHRAPV